MGKPFAGKRQKLTTKINLNLPGWVKTTSSWWGNIVDKATRAMATEAAGEEVCRTIHSYARKSVIGLSFDSKVKAIDIANKRAEQKDNAHFKVTEKFQGAGQHYSTQELNVYKKNVVKSLRAEVEMVNAEEQYRRFAVYIWQIMARTPVDERYYKIYKTKKIKKIHKESPLSKFWNTTEEHEYISERLEEHIPDDKKLRDSYIFQLGSAKNHITISSKELSMIDFDVPLSQDHITVITNIIRTKFNKPVVVKAFTISLIGDHETQEKYKAIEFGQYGMSGNTPHQSTSDWQQAGNAKKQHGTRAGYSVQAPFGIATLAQIEQEVMDEIMTPKLDKIRGNYTRTLKESFDEVAKFLNSFALSSIMFDKIALDATSDIYEKVASLGDDIGVQNPATDVKYMADIEIVKKMYRGDFSKQMQEKLAKEISEKDGKFHGRAEIDFKKFEEKNIKISAMVKRRESQREEAEQAKRRHDIVNKYTIKEKRRIRRKPDDKITENKKKVSAERMKSKAALVAFSRAVRALNRGWNEQEKRFFIALSDIDPIIKQFEKNISDYKAKITSLKRDSENGKFTIRKYQKYTEKFMKEDIAFAKREGTYTPELANELKKFTQSCNDVVNEIEDEVSKYDRMLRDMYNFQAEYLDSILKLYKELPEGDKKLIDFDIDQGNNGVIIDFMGDVQKVSNKSIVLKSNANGTPDIEVPIFDNDHMTALENARKEVEYNETQLKKWENIVNNLHNKSTTMRYMIPSKEKAKIREDNAKMKEDLKALMQPSRFAEGRVIFLPDGWMWADKLPPKTLSELKITNDKGIKADYVKGKGFRYFEDGKGIIWIRE